ncbi:nuclear fragile X mental retardation-interacting protein 1 [Pectinophora gossypiella]|uniref:nuclear fragile X mental retardation-interacting protein 1 n=1 Tax=Pectinophora gossypiella TaxID=13191 RepID=UPI00214F54A8|nr:nuclear fragile X mental retardation-interacting protein 1 [Pectinophora gossypiella]
MYRPRLPFMADNYKQNFRPPFQIRSNFSPRGRPPRFGYQSNQRNNSFPRQHDEEYWCETCDRGFPNAGILAKHKQEHETCNIDGCKFTAHPKVITNHIKMQHSSGLFKKIANLKNPEEIEKWREERKKRYPTKINVEKKAAETKEKIERGEKMGLKHDKNRKSDQTHKRTHEGRNNESGDKRKKIVKPNLPKKMPARKEIPLPVFEYNRKLKPFAGILSLTIDSDNEENAKQDVECSYIIEDDEDCPQQTVPETKPSKTGEPSVCSALSSLMCEYGSSDEEREITHPPNISIGPSVNNSKESKTPIESALLSQHKNTIEKHESDDDSGPEEVKVDKQTENETDIVPENSKENIIRRIQNKRHNPLKKPVNRKPKSKLPSTLLQKLLHREIQQERNIVLQCIRHIVKHNYFDK